MLWTPNVPLVGLPLTVATSVPRPPRQRAKSSALRHKVPPVGSPAISSPLGSSADGVISLGAPLNRRTTALSSHLAFSLARFCEVLSIATLAPTGAPARVVEGLRLALTQNAEAPPLGG